MAEDFYQELGVGRKASADEIRRAYRKLASQYHPDKNPGNHSAEARFKAINRAHDVLSDPKKRALYDEFGELGLREGFNPNAARAYRGGRGGGFSGGLEDILGGNFGGFGDLFGEMFQKRGARGGAKPPDTTADVEVDFIDALRGTNVTLRSSDGTDVRVRIPPGAGDGDRVRVAGKGQRTRGGVGADLLLTIRVRSHPYFEREGLDLKLDVPISAAEAYQGTKVRVPTPSGDVTLKVPKHAQSGQLVRLKGKGVVKQSRTGDLYVRFMVRMPQVDDEKLEQAAQTLADATDVSMRDKIQL